MFSHGVAPLAARAQRIGHDRAWTYAGARNGHVLDQAAGNVRELIGPATCDPAPGTPEPASA